MTRTNLVGSIGGLGLTLETVKEHLVVEHNLDDALIQLYLDAAIEHVQDETRRVLALSQYAVTIPEFDGSETITLGLPPIRAVSEITYDDDGTTMTLSTGDYTVKLDSEYAYLVPDSCWPSGCDMKLTVLAGYGELGTAVTDLPAITFTHINIDNIDLPNKLKLAALMLTAHWYANREATIGLTMSKVPAGVDALLAKYRNYKI